MSEVPLPCPETDTHCPYCALQCGTRLTGDHAAGVTVEPTDFPVNRGRLCQKGWTAPQVLTATDRLLTPLVRGRDSRLTEASWDTALDTVAEGLLRIRAQYGPDALAVFGGGGLTNEKAYLLGKFARLALGTSQIDYNGGSACRLQPPRATTPSVWTAACPSPSPTSPGRGQCSSPAPTSRRPCRP